MRRIVSGGTALLLASLAAVACSEAPQRPACTSDSECLQGQFCNVETGRCFDENPGGDDAGGGAVDAGTSPPPPPPVDAGRPGRSDAGSIEVPDGGAWLAQVVFDRTSSGAQDRAAGAWVTASVSPPERSGFCATGEWDEPEVGVECCYTGRAFPMASYNAGAIAASAAGDSVTLEYEAGLYGARELAFEAGDALRANIAGHDPIPSRAAGPLALPADLELAAPASGAALPRDGFELKWNPATVAGARVVISVVQRHPQAGEELGAVDCMVPDDGEYRLSTYLLQNLLSGSAELAVQRLVETARPPAGESGLQLVARNGERVRITLQ